MLHISPCAAHQQRLALLPQTMIWLSACSDCDTACALQPGFCTMLRRSWALVAHKHRLASRELSYCSQAYDALDGFRRWSVSFETPPVAAYSGLASGRCKWPRVCQRNLHARAVGGLLACNETRTEVRSRCECCAVRACAPPSVSCAQALGVLRHSGMRTAAV